MLLSFLCAGQKVRAPALPEGQKDVELPGTRFLRVSNFLRACPEAPAGRATSPALPRPLLGDGHRCRASASPQHPPRCSPLPKGAAGVAVMGWPHSGLGREVGGQGCPPQAPLLQAPPVPPLLPFPPFPFPSHPFPSCVSHFLAFCDAWEPSRIFSAVAQPTSEGRDG